MKTKRILLVLLALTLLSCNYVTQMLVPPTPTAIPTLTQTSTPSPTPTVTPLLPAYIPPQCEGQAIATLSPDVDIYPTPEFETKEITLRTQLQVLDEIDHIVREVYVYPDFNGRDWNEIVERYRSMVEDGLTTDDFYFEMYNMLGELGDDHSTFIPPIGVQQVEAELKGESQFVGIGAYSNADFDRGRLIVISTFPGSPAAYAGLKPHDSVLLIDGEPITRESGVRTLGPECTAVRLTVQSPGEAPRDMMLIRSEINGTLPIDSRLVPTTDGSKIGYIFIPSFADETFPPQIEEALQEFGQLDGLILDLRWNGGGSSTVAYPIMGFFTGGKLGEFVSRTDSRPLRINANPIQNSQTVPLVVMVSEDTVSFGEVFAGLMRDARGAKITGETSLGNVEVLHVFPLRDGSQIWVAAETFDSDFSDDDWEATGIIPDLPASAPWDSFDFNTDPGIAASLELLGHH